MKKLKKIFIPAILLIFILTACSSSKRQGEELIPEWTKILLKFNFKELKSNPGSGFLFAENEILKKAEKKLNGCRVDSLYFGIGEFRDDSETDFVIVINGKFVPEKIIRFTSSLLMFVSMEKGFDDILDLSIDELKKKIYVEEIEETKVISLKKITNRKLAILNDKTLIITNDKKINEVIKIANGDANNIMDNQTFSEHINSIKNANLFWGIFNITDHTKKSLKIKEWTDKLYIGTTPIDESEIIKLQCYSLDRINLKFEFISKDESSSQSLKNGLELALTMLKQSSDFNENIVNVIKDSTINKSNTSVYLTFPVEHRNVQPLVKAIILNEESTTEEDDEEGKDDTESEDDEKDIKEKKKDGKDKKIEKKEKKIESKIKSEKKEKKIKNAIEPIKPIKKDLKEKSDNK